jgi:hypothetical protein
MDLITPSGFKLWSTYRFLDLVHCDVQVAIERHPLRHFTLWKAVCCVYIAFFTCYCIYSALHLLKDIRDASEVRHFTQHRLGLSERQLKTVSWPEVARRIVEVRLRCTLSSCTGLRRVYRMVGGWRGGRAAQWVPWRRVYRTLRGIF